MAWDHWVQKEEPYVRTQTIGYNMPEEKTDVVTINLNPVGKAAAICVAVIGTILGTITLAKMGGNAFRMPDTIAEIKAENASLKESMKQLSITMGVMSERSRDCNSEMLELRRDIAAIKENAQNAKVLSDEAKRDVEEMKIENARKGVK